MHKATVPLIALMCLKLIFSPSFQQSASSSISQTSAGRKTETSSDASQEAPERARKDTPKEANCISRAASLLCVFTSVVSQAFLRRVPSPQGCGYCSSPPCAGNLFRLNDLDLRPSRLDSGILYHKIRSAAENAARTDSPPQTYPGSLCRTLLVSILIYGGNRKI